MAEVIQKTATSFILCEILDFCSCILDRQGRIVTQSELGLPLHVASSELQLKCALDTFGDNFYPGDVILQNDPYSAAGNHLPDWTMIRPIFIDDKLTYFALCKGHQMDTKGAYPGGYFPGAHDIHSEGLLIPPTKIYERDTKQPVYDFILHNIRWPESVRIDNMAMIAALKIADKNTQALCAKYGKEVVIGVADFLLNESERAVREEIRGLSDGEYEGTSIVDRDGSGNENVRVSVVLRICDDQIEVDFSKSDAEVTFVNSPIGCTHSATYMAILPIFDSNIIKNHGALAPIKIVAPEGSVVNPRFPATIGACGCFTATTIIEAIYMALGKVAPDKAPAAWCPSFSMVTFGEDPNSEEDYWMVTFQNDGGGGAVDGFDGCHHVAPVVCGGNIFKCPVELAEIKWPWRTLKYELRTDSGGAGKYRGGLGIAWEAVNEGGKGMAETGAMSGENSAPFGQNGGKEGTISEIYVVRNGEKAPIHTMALFPIEPGDLVGTNSSGGGGVGNPFERSMDNVKEDVLNGFVSIDNAREDYGVVIDPETFSVDEEATRRLRDRPGELPHE